MSAADFDLSHQAKRCYDTLAILVPDVQLGGLFTDGSRYFLVCQEAFSRRIAGQTLADWFHSSQVPAGFSIEVTDAVPAGAVEVQPRTLEEVAIGKGNAATLDTLFPQLSLALPHDFPIVGLSNGIGAVRVLVSRELSPEDTDLLAKAARDVGMAPRHEVQVTPDSSPGPIGNDALVLQPSRAFSARTTPALAALIEEDEEYWKATRVRLLAGKMDEDVSERPWPDLSDAACLVATIFEPDNIRRYLSFYSRLVLVAPIAESLDRTLNALRVSRRDLTALVGSGHVRVLFPQSFQRYDEAWVAELAEANAGALLFSRRLAAAALGDTRRRLPMLFAPATANERRGLLKLLTDVVSTSPPQVRPFFAAMLGGLPESWSRLEFLMNASGAMAAMDGPLVHVAASLVKGATGRDVAIELGAVSATLEWAGALGTDLCPAGTDGYSESGAAKLLIALHTGCGGDNPPVARAQELTIADNLLAVDNDAAVIDFVRDLGTSDRDRFRALVRGVGANTRTEGELREAISEWNAFVRKYDRNPDRVRAFGLSGIILAGVKTLVSGDLSITVPLLTALAPFLVTKLSEGRVRENKVVGAFLDRVNGALAKVHPGAVLLSRMQKGVAGMKERTFRS